VAPRSGITKDRGRPATFPFRRLQANLLRQTNTAEQTLKAGVGAQKIEARLNADFENTKIMSGSCFLQPDKGMLTIP